MQYLFQKLMGNKPTALDLQFLETYRRDCGIPLQALNETAWLRKDSQWRFPPDLDSENERVKRLCNTVEQAKLITARDFFRQRDNNIIVCGHTIPSIDEESGAQNPDTNKQNSDTYLEWMNALTPSDIDKMNYAEIAEIAENFYRRCIPNAPVATAFGLLLNQKYLQSLSFHAISELINRENMPYVCIGVDDLSSNALSMEPSVQEEGLYLLNIKKDSLLFCVNGNNLDKSSSPRLTVDLTIEFRDQGNGKVRLDLTRKELCLYSKKTSKMTSAEKEDLAKIKKIFKSKDVKFKNVKDFIPATERLEKNNSEIHAKSQERGILGILNAFLDFFCTLFGIKSKNVAYVLGSNQEGAANERSNLVFMEYITTDESKSAKSSKEDGVLSKAVLDRNITQPHEDNDREKKDEKNDACTPISDVFNKMNANGIKNDIKKMSKLGVSIDKNENTNKVTAETQIQKLSTKNKNFTIQ